ncbi:MAG: lytic murein transglycosylase [Nocardia sp.]|nr:lytic murein transglycosylase [Nocardia sp.]
MGRHRKQPATTVRRSSLIALTGLVPAGLVAVTAAATEATTATNAAVEHDLLPGAEPEATADLVASPQADIVEAVHAEARQSPSAKPVVKTIALPNDRASADLPAGPLGIPGIAVAAYQTAEQQLAVENPHCGMSWSLLAGIGRVESTHAYGKADAQGNPIKAVYGPVLDGSLSGNNVIHDSDGGELDGLGSYDRAIGPMQFLPETWHRYAADGNADGVADPQNLFDAALTAGRYLCDGGLDMRDWSQQSKAILRYNNSMAYVANVMAWSGSYSSGLAPKPQDLPQIH